MNAVDEQRALVLTPIGRDARLAASILERAASGNVVVVTDAGMPGISDPGNALVAAARAAGIGVEVLPGPTAFVCAAVLSGFDVRRFVGHSEPWLAVALPNHRWAARKRANSPWRTLADAVRGR